ncbi:MAG: hypothetical protein NWS53_01980, partial [Salibacteraceae bacterium]|nr:hypothetical protein [Salibacteraceae bacterium]
RRFNLQNQPPFSKRGFNIGFRQSTNIKRLELYYEVAFKRQANIKQNFQHSICIGLEYVISK